MYKRQTLSLSGDGTTVDLSPYLDDTDTNLSQEEVQDFVGSMVSGNTETGITVTYDDAANEFDLVATDASATNEIQDLGSSASGTDRTITISDGGASTTIDVADNDNNSTNEIQDLSRTGNTLSLSGDGTTVDLSPYLDDTDTNLSQEEVQDFIGSMVSGNTETGITVTYDDAANEFDLVATDASATNELQDLGSSASGTDRTITINGGNNTTISVADNDNDSSNELQSISQAGDVVTLSEGGGSFTDNHLGTTDQTLSASRTVTQGAHDLNFDANTLVIDGQDSRVGVGTASPSRKLDVDNGQVRFSDYGTSGSTYNNTPGATYQLAVEADGDVVQMNTAKSSRIFYPPAIVIDVSELSADISDGTGDESLDLWASYNALFSGPVLSSTGPGGSVPTYTRAELEYHILDLDQSVFGNIELDSDGNFTYDVISVPPGNCTYINVVFVVK